MNIPNIIGEAKVICYALVANLLATGNTTHVVGNQLREDFYALAICKYQNDAGHYLFYCDDQWEAVTDTWHETIEEAKDQGESEYFGVTWVTL